MQHQGSGSLEGLVSTPAHHVSDPDRFVRAMRAGNDELRSHIARARSELAAIEAQRHRHQERERKIGATVFRAEVEVRRLRDDAAERIAATHAAGAEEIERLLAEARAEANRIRRVLDKVDETAPLTDEAGDDTQAAVVRFTPRAGTAADDEAPGRSTGDRSEAI